jgi:hypothetical protein
VFECRTIVRANIEMAPNLIGLESEKVKVGCCRTIANDMITKWSLLFRLKPCLNCLAQAKHANT